jgi:pyruvate,water dikinase
MQTEYIYNLKGKTVPETIGAKAKNLRFLAQKNFAMPETFVCTWDAYKEYLQPIGIPINDKIKAELSKKLNPTKQYAIRSSANIEDGTNYSCAGQFKSILNVTGTDNILTAIESIWSSTCSENVKTYLKKIGADSHSLRMAVIIQEMVHPGISGVTFTRNPMTGMDEIIVEATMGNGENLVQNGHTPERWVNKWGEWIVKPESSPIETDLIQDVVSNTKKIAETFGTDVDVEWVYDGSSINWVQLREITSLKDSTLYSNHIAREVFPGLIKPLIWSINVPLVCSGWLKLFEQLVGQCDIDPHSLAKAFYYRAYFNMGTIGKIFEALGLPSDTLELLLDVESGGSEKPTFKPTAKTLRLLPKLIRFAIDKTRFAKKIDAFLPDMKNRYSAFSIDNITNLKPEEIIRDIDKLNKLNEETAYYMIVTYSLMGVYNGLLKYQLKKYGISIDTIDLTKGIDELNDFNPVVTLSTLNHNFSHLKDGIKEKISNSSYQDFLTIPGINSFQKSVNNFIEHFGHLSDSGNDFSCTPWRENRDNIITMIVNYTHRNETTSHKSHFSNLNISSIKKIFLHPLYKRSRKFLYYREAVGFLYTYGYGLFRPYFLALGDYFSLKGWICSKDDIFYLSFPEIQALVKDESQGAHYKNIILQRKEEMEEFGNISLPHIIYGDKQPPINRPTGNILSGIPTSKGIFEGKAQVIHGVADFNKLSDGDVLIIPFSDVGLTPLFTKAGAIVSESGGFLSHSSIIAREYEIPAVVSVPEACQIEDNTTVTVDGYKGEIIIHQQ